MPAAYLNNTFLSCLGDNQQFPGVYVSGGRSESARSQCFSRKLTFDFRSSHLHPAGSLARSHHHHPLHPYSPRYLPVHHLPIRRALRCPNFFLRRHDRLLRRCYRNRSCRRVRLPSDRRWIRWRNRYLRWSRRDFGRSDCRPPKRWNEARRLRCCRCRCRRRLCRSFGLIPDNSIFLCVFLMDISFDDLHSIRSGSSVAMHRSSPARHRTSSRTPGYDETILC